MDLQPLYDRQSESIAPLGAVTLPVFPATHGNACVRTWLRGYDAVQLASVLATFISSLATSAKGWSAATR
jgi:hypothetical protein